MLTRSIPVTAMLASGIFVTNACAAVPSAHAGTVAPSTASAVLPIAVHGALPGYSDTGLARLVRQCAAAEALPDGWRMQVNVADIHVPRSFTLLRATLTDGNHVVASRWI